MTLFEYLDRVGQRRAARQRRPLDTNAVIGFLFLGGYYWMVYQFTQRSLPVENLDLIRDAMLTLGPPVGIIVGALFRTDQRDLMATENTAEGFRTMGKQADASLAITEAIMPNASAAQAAEETAGAAQDKADEYQKGRE